MRTIKQQLTSNVIVKALAGSHAYGMSLPTSDVDYRGIFVADPMCIRTPFHKVKELVDSTEEDTKYYELNHFMLLAVNCNPNIIELLWTDWDDIVFTHPAFVHIRNRASELLSANIAHTTVGFALSQLKRIKGHNKWIMNPQPEEKPQQADFVSLVHNFTADKVFKLNLREHHRGYRLEPYSGDCFGVYRDDACITFYDKTGQLYRDHEHPVVGEPLFIGKFNADAYEQAKTQWEQYWDWKNNRNVARSELEIKHGYDTKHASHLVRLLRMGAEALTTGEILVHRPDAEELLSIRHGAWTYEQVIEYAERMNAYVLGDLYKTTKLRKTPNIDLATQLILDVQDMVWPTLPTHE